MKLVGKFANLERVIIARLKVLLVPASGWYIANEEPADLASTKSPLTERMTVVVVEQIPGGSGGEEFESENDCDVTVYSDTLDHLADAVSIVEIAMRDVARHGPVQIDTLVQTSGFGRIPYSNTKVRRAVGTYRGTNRPQ